MQRRRPVADNYVQIQELVHMKVGTRSSIDRSGTVGEKEQASLFSQGSKLRRFGVYSSGRARSRNGEGSRGEDSSKQNA